MVLWDPMFRPTLAAMASVGAAIGLVGCSGGSAPGLDGGASEATDARTDGGSADGAAYSGDAGCQPGVARCHGNFGYQMCMDDGTWGTSISCAGYSANGTSSYCVTIDNWGYCVDPACWYWITHGFDPAAAAVGICAADGTFSRCGTGGTLAPFVCAAGCTQAGALDGRALGYCNVPCAEGAQECLGGPLYRVCTGGKWSDSPAQCPGGQMCHPLATGAVPQIECGGACDPGTSRCAADAGGVESCTAGQWVAGSACLLGRCVQAGPQAQCQAECSAGQHQCAYDGASGERSCADTGLWNPEVVCAQGTSCRVNGTVAVGCVACVGSNANGGNAYGGVDSACLQGGLAVCGPDNTWGPPVVCGAGTTCVQLPMQASSVASCEPAP